MVKIKVLVSLPNAPLNYHPGWSSCHVRAGLECSIWGGGAVLNPGYNRRIRVSSPTNTRA